MRALGFARCFSLALLFLAIPATSFAGVFVSAAVAPPVLPVCKRLTNTPVRQAGSVLKCPDDRKTRVVSAQATYTSGSSGVGG
jgi:hypothetical protein